MNIFYLDPNPKTCAEMHCDQHIKKMPIEYAQLLSTAHRMIDGREMIVRNASGRRQKIWVLDDWREDVLYKTSHYNHPSNIWARQSLCNYEWLYRLFRWSCEEYRFRRIKADGSAIATELKLLDALCDPPRNIPNRPFTEPTPAMNQFPECVVEGDSLASYKRFYIADKSRFATWSRRPVPEWFAKGLERKRSESITGRSRGVDTAIAA